MFCDVFNDVIVVVVYIKIMNEDLFDIGFFLGKVKLVFSYGYIILWLELCFVVVVVELVEVVKE